VVDLGGSPISAPPPTRNLGVILRNKPNIFP
jgi:hypothetical protein